MKKFIIGILIIAILVFGGMEILRKKDNGEGTNQNISTSTSNTNTSDLNETTTNTKNEETSEPNTTTNTTVKETPSTPESKKVTNGEQLLQEAKTITARGWAGASNNVVGLKDETLYYYNKSSGEFYIIAEGIDDIYLKTEFSEDITAKKGKKFKEIKEKPTFVEYE